MVGMPPMHTIDNCVYDDCPQHSGQYYFDLTQ